MEGQVARLNTALSGRYVVTRELGEGGMATVYLADDIRHGRKVALKVLQPELAAIMGANRFLTEIRTTASLQHPHILPLFDSGDADGLLFYVMPLIEGESLRDRLHRERQLPVSEAVRIATNVAEALDYAHRHGVIHRDIKPANILLHDSKPLVSDFGIALAVTGGAAGRLTGTGLSLGTPHYMSPEQATGDASVGQASDIWALGCVLYEMLVGEPPYTGSTPQAVLGKIIAAAPPSASLARKSVPPNVDAVIRRALEKIPADRFTGAGAFAAALADPGFRHGEVATVVASQSDSKWRRVSLALGGLAAVLAVAAASALVAGGDDEPLERVTLTLTPPTGVLIDANWGLAVSPDGRTVVYYDDASRRLFRRDLSETSSIPIAGTESSWKPFFSPDGASIGFFDETQNLLKRVRLDGSGVQTISEAPATARSGGWREDGTIVFYSSGLGGLSSVPEGGGEIRAITRADSTGLQSTQLNWLSIPPGGRVAVGARPVDGVWHIVGVDLETGSTKVLFANGFSPRYQSGYLLYGRENAVWAVPFDLERLEVTGPPTLVAEGVFMGADRAIFEVSDGVLVYAPVGSRFGAGAQQLVWIDRAGNQEPLGLEPGRYRFPRISPDGRKVALVVIEGGNSDIMVYDLDERVSTRLTFEPSLDWGPLWTPDGSRIVFQSNRDGPRNLYAKRADGLGDVQRLTEAQADQRAYAITSDGALVYTQGGDVWMLPEPGAAPRQLTRSAHEETLPSLSPNGRFLALQSNELGWRETFVHSFPDMSGKWLVSTLDIAPITSYVNADMRDGWSPVWSKTGRELYYQSGVSSIIRVPVTTDGAFTHGSAEVAFELGVPGPADGPHFDVANDGERLLTIGTTQGTLNELIVVQNWQDVLQEPAGN
jgi:serine/threonine-protein kinase